MNAELSRRAFIRTTAMAGAAVGVGRSSAAEPVRGGFSFVLLGDLHFDRLSHHDQKWLENHKPDDVRQVADYSRATAEFTPRLFKTVREQVRSLQSEAKSPAFVMQVGDLVEGLCGSEELATKQNRDALEAIAQAQLGVPFVFTKGNHDITGPGAADAFRSVFHPFLQAQCSAIDPAAQVTRACSVFHHGDALFCCLDAYDGESLSWLEATLAKRTEKHCFVIVHPPVVPYGARATWFIYANARQRLQRDKLLELLGRNRACVLGGHIHKFNALVREVPRAGRFVQLAVSSIIRNERPGAKTVLNSVTEYNGDQVKVEPGFSPSTEQERRGVYEEERRFVKAFQYADLPGYAIVSVNGQGISARIYSGVTRELWRTVELSQLAGA